MTNGQAIALCYDAVEHLPGDRDLLAAIAAWTFRLLQRDLAGRC